MTYACFRLKSGETMYSFCKRNGLNKSTAWRRADAGMSPDDIVDWLIANKGKGRGLNNCKYLMSSGNSLVSEARKLGLSESNAKRLVIEKKMSPDDAIKELISAKNEKRGLKRLKNT